MAQSKRRSQGEPVVPPRVFTLPAKDFPGRATTPIGDFLSDGQVVAIELAHAGGDFPVIEIGDAGYRLAE